MLDILLFMDLLVFFNNDIIVRLSYFIYIKGKMYVLS